MKLKSIPLLSTLLVAGCCAALQPAAQATEALLTDDTTTFSGSAAATYGDSSNLLVNSSSTKVTLLHFEIKSMLPDGITANQVATATLRFYCNATPTGTGSVSLHTVTATWTEAALAGVFNSYTTTASVTVPVGSFGNNAFTAIDVTTMVKAWITTPTSNYGLMVRPTTSPTIGLSLDSKENTTQSHYPTLEITLKENNTVLNGSGTPAIGVGTNGDFYIDTASTAKNLYGPKLSTGWGSSVALVGATGTTGATGAQGIPGISVVNGTGAPANSGGNNGDIYMDTQNGRVYGPKTAGAWGTTYTSLVGPTGSTGPAVTRISPHGDLPMGSYATGTNPNN